MCTEISAQIERYPSRYPRPCSGRLLMARASATQILTSARKGNAMSVALATERNSAMNRSELADLNAFVVVANHLSFRAASTQLGVTASALSHSMRQLEDRHGVRLLHRTTRSVSLTDARLRLLEQLRPPPTFDDLASHSCIQYRFAPNETVLPWSFERNGTTKRMTLAGAVTVNDPYLAVRAAVDGLGIAYTVEALAEPFLQTGQLVRVLERSSPCLEGLFLYYPGHRQVPAGVRDNTETGLR